MTISFVWREPVLLLPLFADGLFGAADSLLNFASLLFRFP
jgi:hypothetical protein